MYDIYGGHNKGEYFVFVSHIISLSYKGTSKTSIVYHGALDIDNI